MGRTLFFSLIGTFVGLALPLAALAEPPASEAPAEAPPAAESQPAPEEPAPAEPPKADETPKTDEAPPAEPQPEPGPAPDQSEEKPAEPSPDVPKSDVPKSDAPKSDEEKQDKPKAEGDKPESKADKSKGEEQESGKPEQSQKEKSKEESAKGETEKKGDSNDEQKPAEPQPRRVEWDDKVSAVIEKPSPQSLDDLRIIQKQLQRVVEAATPATVSVRVGNAFGSGVIVSADGLVLTAGHVVGQPNTDVTFIFPDGKTAKGKTLGMNQQIDSGMMKITDPGPWPFVPVAKSGDIKGGQWVVAIGQPGGFDGERTPPVRLGRVLFANGDVINTDCTLVGGDSGGPLFNMQGEVVGIHSRIGRRITNNFHVPISTYHETWDRLAAAESWGNRLGGSEPVRTWPMLGIAGKRGAERCEVTQVYPDRPAAVAGLKVGDVITSFAGKPVNSFEELGKLLADQKPLSQVEVELKRGDETLKLNVRLGITNRRIPGSYNDQTKPS